MSAEQRRHKADPLFESFSGDRLLERKGSLHQAGLHKTELRTEAALITSHSGHALKGSLQRDNWIFRILRTKRRNIGKGGERL